MIDWLCDNWDQPEEGIWETRGGRQPFVYGRMMCWVAIDRAIRMAAQTGSRPRRSRSGRSVRDAINEQIVAQGWNEEIEALVQHYGSDVLDASVLRALRLHYLVPDRRDLARHARTRSRTSSSPTASCTATTRRHRPTACKAPKARSRCARSGTSTR